MDDLGRVRRVQDGVERPTHRWTPAVHELLRYLRSSGFIQVPQPLRLDDQHEVLSWVPGDAGPLGWANVASVEGLESMARLLRTAHDHSRGFQLSEGLSWADLSAPRNGEVVCHGDFGPWNVTWTDGVATGLFDWDMAYSGPAIDDVAYALEYVAPFRSDDEAQQWLSHTEPPNRAARVRAFIAAYSGRRPTQAECSFAVRRVLHRQKQVRQLALRLASEGIEPQATWVRDGADSDWSARIAWTRAHLSMIAEG